MADRTNIVTINSVTYRLQQQADESRSWRVKEIPLDESQNRPQIIDVPFGSFGMGSSYEGVVPGEYHYALGLTTEIQGQVGPAPKLNTVTLTGAGTVTKLIEGRDANGAMYLYIVNASAKLFKLALSDVSTLYTKTFTHGVGAASGSPILTDLVVIKDGSAPGITERTVTQPAGGFLMAGFGETAGISYTDAIAAAGADTWYDRSVSGSYGSSACAGVFGLMQGASNTSTLVYKSTGASSQSAGAFCRLQYCSVLDTSGTDLSITASWTPSTPYKVGQYGTSINSIIEGPNGPLIGKPEGVYRFDQNYNNQPQVSFQGYKHSDNAKAMSSWGSRLIIPTRFDLIDSRSGAIGITTLRSNTSPVQGYPTAFAFAGDEAYAAYYDGTDTYLCKLRPRRGEPVPQDFLIHSFAKLSGKVCQAMRVVTNVAGITYLFYGVGTDLGYVILGPAASRTYADGGTLDTPIFGSPGKKFVLDGVSVIGRNITTSTATYAVKTSLDGGAYSSLGSLSTGDGLKEFTLTPGTGNIGSTVQIQLACTNGTSSNQPLLVGGAVSLKLQWIGSTVTAFDFTIDLGAWSSTGLAQDRDTVWRAIRTLVRNRTPIDMIYADYFGDGSGHKVLLTSCEWVDGQGTPGQSAMASLRITARELLGTT